MAKEVVLDVDGPTAPVKDPRGNVHGRVGNHNRQPPDFSGMGTMVGDEISITIDGAD